MGLRDHFIPARLQEFRPRDGDSDRSRLQEIARGLSDLISLNSGDPDLTAAPVAVEAAVEALRSGRTRYVFGGLPELRQAIGRKLAAENGFTVDVDTQLVVTNGSAEAYSIVLQTLLESGDEVLTTDPGFSGHVHSIIQARGVPVFVPTRGEDLWEPDPAEVERRVTPRTRAFIFANPGNPTGAVYRRETLKRLLDLAHRKNILMIPDELFERYVYDGSHISMASLPGSEERVVTVSGFSKSYCMTGWRVGWIAAPRWLADTLWNVHFATTMTTGTPVQWGAVAALSDAARPYYDDAYRTYGERRAFFYDAFTRLGLPQRTPPGTYVGMVDVRPMGLKSAAVAEAFLREARVFVWPGTSFGPCGEGYLRVGLIRPLETLKDMMRRLEPVVAHMLAATKRR